MIPTRDRPELLRRALASALGQDGVAVEVLVVDDGSLTPVVEQIADQARTVQVLRNDRPRGQAAARNAGLSAAGAPWVAFLDDDDLWAPSRLARLIGEADDRSADFVFSGGVVVDERLQVLSWCAPPPERGRALYRRLLEANVIPCGSSNVVCRTALARSVGGLDEAFSTVVDWDFNVRLGASGAAAGVDEPLIAYTVHGGNAHLDPAAAEADRVRFAGKHAAEQARERTTLDRAWWLRWRASTLRHAGDRRGAAAAFVRLGLAERRPGNVARGLALAVGGERALAAARAFRSVPPPPEHAPGWLERWADGHEAAD